jgi:hypothetical protein
MMSVKWTGIVDDLYMFDGIAGGRQGHLEGEAFGGILSGLGEFGGRSAASPRPTTSSTALTADLALARS